MDEIKMDKITSAVVTGATSMIASAVIRELLRQDAVVYAVVRPGSPKMGNLPAHRHIHRIECDLSELGTLPEKIGAPCDAFFHFGWSGTSRDQRNDGVTQSRNIGYTLDAVSAASRLGCGVFVGAGSQAEYGRVQGDLRPDTPVSPENAYGIAKYAAGRMSALRCRELGIRHIWARILSVYGPGDNGSTMMMSCIRAFLRGEHMSFTPGEQMWDYLYCDDAASAFCRMALCGTSGAVYPLGSGRAIPLREYIETVRNLIDPSLESGIGERLYPPQQVMYLCADLTALTRDTGFEPKTDFTDGIRKTIEWCRSKSAEDKK